jgi:hypothetical protein
MSASDKRRATGPARLEARVDAQEPPSMPRQLRV